MRKFKELVEDTWLDVLDRRGRGEEESDSPGG